MELNRILKELVRVCNSDVNYIQKTLCSTLREVEIDFERKEKMIQAFLSEEGRFERIFEESRNLLEQHDSDSELFGIPIAVKDIFHVTGFLTRCGSKIPDQYFKKENEAICVKSLRDAGALVFGKTQTTEFAYFAPSPTRNPNNFDFTPGGSSSGSAASVASRMVPLALGTQTIGSISRPASYCGCIGFKPSFDRIDNTGVVPLAPSLDHVGFFTNEIQLAQEVASVLCESWDEQSNLEDLETINFGVPVGNYLQRAESEMLEVFYDVVSEVEDCQSYKVDFIPILGNIDALSDHVNVILAFEAALCHQEMFEKHGNLLHPKTADLITKGLSICSDEYLESKKQREILRDNIECAMTENGIHAWLSPSATGPAPRGLESTGDPIMNLPWSMSGHPTISIPMGKNSAVWKNPESGRYQNHHNLPLGLQVSGRYWKDEVLFRIVQRLCCE